MRNFSHFCWVAYANLRSRERCKEKFFNHYLKPRRNGFYFIFFDDCEVHLEGWIRVGWLKIASSALKILQLKCKCAIYRMEIDRSMPMFVAYKIIIFQFYFVWIYPFLNNQKFYENDETNAKHKKMEFLRSKRDIWSSYKINFVQ